MRPAGIAKARIRRTKPGCGRCGEGSRARKKPGMPMVRLAISVRCRGRNGNGQPGHADREGEQRGVDRLGDEQLGHPLDVGDHPAALGRRPTGAWRSGRRAGPARPRPGTAALPEPMAMPMSASLRASTSLTPSPVMATTWPRGLQGVDHGLLLAGHDPAEDRAGLEEPRPARPGRRAGSGRRPGGRRRRCRPGRRPRRRSAGWSPEMTLTSTPSAANQAMVSAASPRTWSPSTTRPAGRAPVGGRSPSSGPSERWPAAGPAGPRGDLLGPAQQCAAPAGRPGPVGGQQDLGCARGPGAAARRSWPRSTCGPRRTARPPRRRQPVGSRERLGRWPAGWRWGSGRRRPGRQGRRRPPPSRSLVLGLDSSCTARSPAVSVPVLSKQITSTRARVSTAGSSWTSTWRRPRRTTPTAKATLVSSTSPSGTMATVPATAPLSPAPDRRAPGGAG